MKNMKKALALVLVFAMLFVVAGCGNKDGEPGSNAKYTAREVADKMIEATAKVKSVQNDITCKISINMAIEAEGTSFDMGMEMDMAVKTITSTDPVAAYSKSEMVMDYMGESETQTTETYLVEEDGEFVTYTLLDGYWDRTVVDAEYKDQLTKGMDYSFLKDMKDSDLDLAKNTEKVEGKETYVLTFSVSGDYLSSMGMDMEELMGMGVDMSKISYPMTMNIDTETFLPVRVSIQINGLSEMIDQLMKESMGDIGAELKIDVKCEDFVTVMSYDVEVPAVPSEAK